MMWSAGAWIALHDPVLLCVSQQGDMVERLGQSSSSVRTRKAAGCFYGADALQVDQNQTSWHTLVDGSFNITRRHSASNYYARPFHHLHMSLPIAHRGRLSRSSSPVAAPCLAGFAIGAKGASFMMNMKNLCRKGRPRHAPPNGQAGFISDLLRLCAKRFKPAMSYAEPPDQEESVEYSRVCRQRPRGRGPMWSSLSSTHCPVRTEPTQSQAPAESQPAGLRYARLPAGRNEAAHHRITGLTPLAMGR